MLSIDVKLYVNASIAFSSLSSLSSKNSFDKSIVISSLLIEIPFILVSVGIIALNPFGIFSSYFPPIISNSINFLA